MVTRDRIKFMIIIFILLFPVVQGISLGTVPKNDYAEVKQGETAVFTILFWNTGNSSYTVTLKPEQIPEDWSVIIRPESFVLNPTKPGTPPYGEGEYVSLPYLGGIVRAETVEILLKVPGSADLGEHTVTIGATAGNVGNDISVLQERMLRLRVNVTRNPTLFEEIGNLRLIGKKVTEQGKNIGEGITGGFSGVSVNLRIVLFTVLVLVGILASLIIYKYKK